ncbi:hypothetical protein QTN25_002453 [Entamoeba marina]
MLDVIREHPDYFLSEILDYAKNIDPSFPRVSIATLFRNLDLPLISKKNIKNQSSIEKFLKNKTIENKIIVISVTSNPKTKTIAIISFDFGLLCYHIIKTSVDTKIFKQHLTNMVKVIEKKCPHETSSLFLDNAKPHGKGQFDYQIKKPE